MSLPREMRERFQKEENTPPSELPSKLPSELPPGLSSEQLAEMIGITVNDMREIIIDDITAMIERGFREALEGYVLCLSRIINHDKSWEFIVTAFGEKNEKVPTKYYKQFGQTSDNVSPPNTGTRVS